MLLLTSNIPRVSIVVGLLPQVPFNVSSRVADVMVPNPYVVRPDTDLSEVVSEMAEHKFGSAIVQQSNGRVVGIFTAVDGLRAFGELLQMRFH